MVEYLVRNAKIVDGSGSPWFRGDLAVAGGKISAIGKLQKTKAAITIDADDMVVCPGFIEIHGHSDATLLINRQAESSIHQGVTTECTGNCGYSLFPVTDSNLDLIQYHLTSIQPDFEIDWRTLPEMKRRYESPGTAVNIVPLAGHNTIRLAVMQSQMAAASPAELKEMVELVEQAMSHGARGFSSGLEYPPGSASNTEELIELVRPVADYNGIYSTHIRNRDVGYFDALEEAVRIGEKTGAAVQISHNVAKIGAPEGMMRKVIERILAARRNNLDIAFDCGAYLGGQTTPTASLPPWAFDGGIEETLKRLADPQAREKMKQYEYPIWRVIKLGMWDKVRLAAAPKSQELVGRTFAEIADIQQKDPYDVLFDILLAEGHELFGVMWEGEIYTEEDRDMVLSHPLTSVCCDGQTLAPYGLLSKKAYHHVYSWIPYLLRYHVRERQLLSLEEAIRKITSLSANRLGLKDRGLIRAGLAADLVIFNPETIHDRATLATPHVYPDGVHYVFVNGKLVLDKGEHTRALPGKVLLNG